MLKKTKQKEEKEKKQEALENFLAMVAGNELNNANKEPFSLKLERTKGTTNVKISREGNALSILIGIVGYLINEAYIMDTSVDEFMQCFNMLIPYFKTELSEEKNEQKK